MSATDQRGTNSPDGGPSGCRAPTPAGASPPGPSGASACVPPSGSTFLDRIIPSVVARLEERKKRTPLEELRASASKRPKASLAEALRCPGLSLIAEVKRASPSKGPIRPGLIVGPLVRAYEEAGARAISVLTEEDHFLGSSDDLRAAAAATQLPLLRKDFVLDDYQLHEARAWGADAVLLIAALLPDETLRRLAGIAGELGLDVLLEVHDRTEMLRALAVEKAIVGINNRDLCTFEVSLETTVALADLVPPGRLLVGESGIWTHDDVVRLASYGVNGVLVGESLLRNPDVGTAIKELMHPVPAVAGRPTVAVKREETR